MISSTGRPAVSCTVTAVAAAAATIAAGLDVVPPALAGLLTCVRLGIALLLLLLAVLQVIVVDGALLCT